MRSSHNHPTPLVDIAGPVTAAPGPASPARSSEARAGQDRRPLWRRARNWDGRVGHVEKLARTPAFLSLREDVIALARVTASDRVLDIGAGTGLLTLAAAPQVRT